MTLNAANSMWTALNSVATRFQIPTYPVAALTPGMAGVIRMSILPKRQTPLPYFFPTNPVGKSRFTPLPDSNEWMLFRKAASTLAPSADKALKASALCKNPGSKIKIAQDLRQTTGEKDLSTETLLEIAERHMTSALILYGAGGKDATRDAGDTLVAGAEIVERGKNSSSHSPQRYFVAAFMRELAGDCYLRSAQYRSSKRGEILESVEKARLSMASAANSWVFGASQHLEPHALARAALLGCASGSSMMFGYSLFMLSNHFSRNGANPRKAAEIAIASAKGYMIFDDYRMRSYALVSLDMAITILAEAAEQSKKPATIELHKALKEIRI